MFWETVAALLLIVTTSPLWILVAVVWGFIRAALTLVAGAVAFQGQTPIEWGEIWVVPVVAIIQGLQSAWSIPAWIWNWAKFEHPWWAVLIALLFASAGRARN